MSPQDTIDRRSRGLRGPVTKCIEEWMHPEPRNEDSGSSTPTMRHEAEFDSEGHLTRQTVHNPDGSVFEMRNTFSQTGLLLKTTRQMNGGALAETINEYDDSGRIRRACSSTRSRDIASYSYDEHGRMKKVQTSQAEDYQPNLSHSGNFISHDRAPNLPCGGSATTVYDEQQRPTEIEVRDELGELVRRVTRIYDEKGDILEEAEFLPDPVAIIPKQSRERILNNAGASAEDFRDQLSKLLAGRSGLWSVRYERDPQGRAIRTRRRAFNREETIETSYNDHGDLSREITRGAASGDSPDLGPLYSEAIHTYQYDANGNWTEEIVSHRSSPNEPFKIISRIARTLTYA
jgi:hypothetical protein